MNNHLQLFDNLQYIFYWRYVCDATVAGAMPPPPNPISRKIIFTKKYYYAYTGELR